MTKLTTDNDIILFEKNIRAILKTINNTKCMSIVCKKQISMLIIILVEIIINISNVSVKNSKKKTIRQDEIRNSIKIITNNNLYEESKKYIDKHIKLFENFTKDTSSSYVSRNKKSCLTISVPIIEKLIRSNTIHNLTKNTSVYLTCFIEYVIISILDSTCYHMKR